MACETENDRGPISCTLIAYQLDGNHYRVIASITEPSRIRVPPFDDIELDLDYILGD